MDLLLQSQAPLPIFHLLPTPLHNEVFIPLLLVAQHLFPYVFSSSSYHLAQSACAFSVLAFLPPVTPHLSLQWQGVESCSLDTCDELEATESRVAVIAAITRLVTKRGLLLIYSHMHNVQHLWEPLISPSTAAGH